MWSNYLTVAYRVLAKNRTYAFVNIFGLALGIGAALLLLLYIRHETSYDAWLPDADRVYQLQTINTDGETGTVERMQMSPLAATRALAKDFPEVELAAYVTNSQPVILQKGEPVQRTITLAEADFFRVFDAPFLHGSGTATLAEPGTVAISARTATALFGTTAALGRVVTALGDGGRIDYRVSGVFADLPRNSHQAFGIVRRLTQADLAERQDTHWGWFGGYSYFKLRPGSDVDTLNARLDAWATRVAPTEDVGGQTVSQVAENRFRLVALPDVHLSGAGSGPAGEGGDRGGIATLAVIAALILAMAIINYVNLSSARASTRAREVSLRKLAGASRRQLVAQFLGESVAIAALAMLLGLAFAELALPWVRDFVRADLALSYFGAGGMLPELAAIALLVGLAGGLYPAFVLTRFQPAEVLRANRAAAEPTGTGRLRNILVVGQFAISIGLMICTAVVYGQGVFARTVDPGFERKGLLQIEDIDRPQVRARIDALLAEIGRIDGVRSTARTRIGVETSSRISNNVTLPGRVRPLELGTYNIDFGFIKTLGMRLLAGRTLAARNGLDDATLPSGRDDSAERALVARGMNVVVNQSAARQLGFATPAAAIGKLIGIGLVDPANGIVPARIVGVVADTRYRSVREPVEDIIYYHDANQLNYLLVRFDRPNGRGLEEAVETAWKEVVPDVPLVAELADDRIFDLYRAERTRAALFGTFALLAVVIACLGLFGLAAFTAERRTKEIGIRKVFGATVRDIVALLAWQFSKPVVLANLIAWPVAWWAMRDWLNQFDARVALTPGPFLLAGLLALAIAMATIAGHAIRIARTNPIHALRYE